MSKPKPKPVPGPPVYAASTDNNLPAPAGSGAPDRGGPSRNEVGAEGAAGVARRTGSVGGVDLQPADPGLSRSSFFSRYTSSSMIFSRSIVVPFGRFTVTSWRFCSRDWFPRLAWRGLGSSRICRRIALRLLKPAGPVWRVAPWPFAVHRV